MCCFPHAAVPQVQCLGPEQRAGEAGGAAASVDADLAAGEGSHIETGLAEAGVGSMVLSNCHQALPAQREYVASEGVALGIVDLDEAESARLEEFDGFHSQPGEIDQRGLLVEQADQRHQVQAG